MTKLSAFLRDEAGAVTVDWVVLTAGIVTFGLVIYNTVRPSVGTLAVGISEEVATNGACLLQDVTITCN